MKSNETLGFVLHRMQYGERDFIIKAFTESFGKITCFAKNSIQSKRFGSGLDLFTAGVWQFRIDPGKRAGPAGYVGLSGEHVNQWHFLEGVEVRKKFDHISKIYEIYEELLFCHQILDNVLIADQAQPELFRVYSHLLNETESAIQKGDDPDKIIKSLRVVLLSKLIRHSGVTPTLQSCSTCSKNLAELTQVTYYLGLGLWTCPNCTLSKSNAERLRDNHIGFQSMDVTSKNIENFLFALAYKTSDAFKLSVDHSLFRMVSLIALGHVPGLDRELRLLVP